MPENNASCAFRTSIGGQALIEGILMRGPKKQAIVCRTAEGLVEKVDELKLARDKYPVLGLPFLRGCAIFISSLVNGMQALTYSASLVPLEQQGEPDKLDKWIEEHFPEDKAQKLIIGLAVVMGIALSVLLFIFLPALLVGWCRPLTQSFFVRNLSEGALKVVILLAYMKLVSNQAPLLLPRRRAQDHLLLRARQGADRGERAAREPLPPPLRHELPAGGGAGEHPRKLRGARLPYACPRGLPPAAAAGGGGHQL